MKKFLLLSLIVGLFACSTEEKKETGGASYTVKPDIENIGQLTYDKLFDNIKFIPLETNRESLIAQISKLFVADSALIVFDQQNDKILMFDLRGAYLRSVGRMGRGPGEYISFSDVQYSPQTKLIYAYDRNLSQIFTYDLSGNLIEKSKDSRFVLDRFYKTNEGVWAYISSKSNNPERYNLVLLSDDLQEIKAGFLPQKEFFNASWNNTFAYDSKGNGYFYYPGSNVIYRLDGSQAVPFCEVNFGAKQLPYDELAQMTVQDTYEQTMNGDHIGDILDVFVNDSSILFRFLQTGVGIKKSYFCWANLNNGQNLTYNNDYTINVPAGLVNSYPLYLSDKTVVFPLYATGYTEDSYEFMHKKFGFLINAESNPVLCVCDLKNGR